MTVTSPDITSLDFTALLDISGAVPAITLTNTSVVVNPTELVWWYVITTPSNTPIHTGSEDDPDVENVAWTTLAITPGSWPQIFGTGQCAQIEFSCNSPYTITVYVKDSTDTIFPLTKTATICRPSGSNTNTCGNFGAAQVGIKTDCANARLICQDNTNYSYQDQLTAETKSSIWTLVYPQSPSGAQPPNGVATNTPTVFFPLSYGGKGLNLYVQDYATYNMGGGIYIKVQYKSQKTFNVWCNVDLCQLQCEMDRFYRETLATCGDIKDPTLNQKMGQINYLYASKILTGILQPLCNIDVPAAIVEMEALFGFTSQCCCDNGVNLTAAPTLPSSGGCCPIIVNVLNKVTGLAPTECPNSFFPARIYDPTGNSIIGLATDADSMVALLNSTASWTAYGFAINAGNCKVAWVLLDPTSVAPTVYVAADSSECIGDTQNYSVTMEDVCTGSVPISVSDFPVNAFVDFDLGAGEVSLGNIANMADLIVALNATPTKPATITFSDGGASSAVIVNIYNSSCTAYSGEISITCDGASSLFMFYGASHLNQSSTPPPPNGAELAYGLRTNEIIGSILGLDPIQIPFHSIKIGTTLIVSQSDTGTIFFWDISNPLQPVFIRFIQLNTVVAANFTGQPKTAGIDNIAIDSFYSLYFPTDYSNMSLSEIYVFEGITGCAWKINMFGGGSGIVASFQNNSLIGACPRVIINNKVFFTDDGTVMVEAGGSIAVGYIATLNLAATFDGSGLGQIQIILAAADRVWAASYDGVDTIWFMGASGTLAQYNISTNTVLATLVNAMGVLGGFTLRGNMKYYMGTLFLSSLRGLKLSFPTVGAGVMDLSLFPASTTLDFFDTYVDSDDTFRYVHNILPLGNCLCAVTGEGYQSAYFSTERGAIAIYRITGEYLFHVKLGTGQNIYNLIAIPGVRVYEPTTLV